MKGKNLLIILFFFNIIACKENDNKSTDITNNYLNDQKVLKQPIDFKQEKLNCTGEPYAATKCFDKEKKLSISFSKEAILFSLDNTYYNYNLKNFNPDLGYETYLFRNNNEKIIVIDFYIENGHIFYVYYENAGSIKFLGEKEVIFNEEYKLDNLRVQKNDSKIVIFLNSKLENLSFDTKKSTELSITLPDKIVNKDSSNTTAGPNFETFDFSGRWKKDCTTDDYVSYILFHDENEATLEIYDKRKFVAKLTLGLDRENKSLTYVGANIIDESIYPKNIVGLSDGEVIGKVQIVDNNQITISWLGLYNKKTKEKMFVQNPFSDKESYTIKRCR